MTLQKNPLQSGGGRIMTGFCELDRLTGGLAEGAVTLIASRPGMGRSSLTLAIAEHLSADMEGTVAIFSLGAGAGDLSALLTRTASGVSGSGKGKIRFFALPSAPVEDICARCRETAELCLVIVDDIECVQNATPAAVRRKFRALKRLARRENIPVICTLRLPRELERREDKRPRSGDLRRTGFRQDGADQIIFLYRDRYYNWLVPGDDTAECIVAKNDHGNTGTAFLQWLPESRSFAERS